jgi:hypothetical protein
MKTHSRLKKLTPALLQIVATVIACLLTVSTLAALTGCAAEDDYDLVIPDTSDGDDDVVIPADKVPGGTSHKATRAQATQYCYEVQYAHYNHTGCWNTYHNDNWLGAALQSCNDNMNNNVTDACVNKYADYVYWLTRRAWSPTLNRYFGDQLRWYCTGGWPALYTPNDTSALYADWLTCEPNI